MGSGKRCAFLAGAAAVFLSVLSTSLASAAPTLVDPKILGVWETQVQGGRWLWTLNPNGTYEFHSEAQDGMPPHSGSFSASGGHWWLRTSDGQTDGGAYRNDRTDTFVATGKSGTWAWKHPARGDAGGNDVIGRILSGIAQPGDANAGGNAGMGIIHCNPCDSSTVN
jgi:hypothetical protein